jgi:hypothetical protein
VRCLIDTMVFDEIAGEPEMAARVGRLTDAGRLELLADTASIAQIAATPDPARRRRLQRVRVLVVPPAGGDPETRALIASLRANAGVDDADAHIAAAAAVALVPLVTEDRALRAALVAHLPKMPVWDWASGLRPRIVALTADMPGILAP